MHIFYTRLKIPPEIGLSLKTRVKVWPVSPRITPMVILILALTLLFVPSPASSAKRTYKNRLNSYNIIIPDNWSKANSKITESSDLTLVNKTVGIVFDIQAVKENSSSYADEHCRDMVKWFKSDPDFKMLSSTTEEITESNIIACILVLEAKDGSHVRAVAFVPDRPRGKTSKYFMLRVMGRPAKLPEVKSALNDFLDGFYPGTSHELAKKANISESRETRNPQIYNTIFAKGVKNGEPVGKTLSFTPDINPIFLWFNFKGIPSGTSIRAVWYYLGITPEYKIGEGSVKVTEGSNWAKFEYELAKGKSWPEGKYRVDIYVNDKMIKSAYFSVKESKIFTNHDEKQPKSNHASVNESLLKAAADGSLDELKKRVASGANLDVKDSRGFTALMLASINGHEQAVEFLLQKGARTDITDNQGETALSLALKNNQLTVARLIIKHRVKCKPMDPFEIAQKMNMLIREKASVRDYLPLLDPDTRIMILNKPELIKSFIQNFQGGVSEPFDIVELVPTGMDYIALTKCGRSVRLRRIDDDENFRISLLY